MGSPPGGSDGAAEAIVRSARSAVPAAARARCPEPRNRRFEVWAPSCGALSPTCATFLQRTWFVSFFFSFV